jgi:hypothetical protein
MKSKNEIKAAIAANRQDTDGAILELLFDIRELLSIQSEILQKIVKNTYIH